jgi:hypothetical protein
MTPGLKAWTLSDLIDEEVKMKRFKLWIGIGLLSILGFIVVVHATSYVERYLVNGTEVWRLNSDGTTVQTGSITAYDILLGAATPTASAFYGVKVPFYASVAMVQGDVVLSSNSMTGYGTIASILSTTSVLGVCDGTYAAGAVGQMTVSGYALVLTTGAVAIGNLVVSTDGSNAAGAAGYAGATTASASTVVGTVIGKAMSVGTAAGGLTLIKLGQ